jgi:hypothetical protein
VNAVHDDTCIVYDVDVVVVGATVACQIEPPDGGWCGAVEDFDVGHLTFGPLVDHFVGPCAINLSHVPCAHAFEALGAYHSAPASEAAGPLAVLIRRLLARPDRICATAVRFLERIHDGCVAHPAGQLDVQAQLFPPGPAQATILSRTTTSCQISTASSTTRGRALKMEG